MTRPKRPVPTSALTLALALALALAITMLFGAVGAASAAEAPPAARLARATFAGGCFWCVEAAFEGLPGVVSVTSGYSGGSEKNPTYEEVGSGTTGHAESVQILYDPKKMAYERLLDVFWHNIDPTSANGQFCDRGRQYRSAIFYHDETQHRLATKSRERLMASGRFKKPIATEVVPLKAFYPAEEFHQDYYKKNPEHYHAYRLGCGRDARLKEIWGAAPPSH